MSVSWSKNYLGKFQMSIGELSVSLLCDQSAHIHHEDPITGLFFRKTFVNHLAYAQLSDSESSLEMTLFFLLFFDSISFGYL